MNKEVTMEKIVALAKNRGFVYPGSEIYGGLANTWDYGPLGVEFKNNVKKAWWKKFVQESRYNVGLDAAILMNPRTWEASGHVGGFADPLIDCKECKARFRAVSYTHLAMYQAGLEGHTRYTEFLGDEDLRRATMKQYKEDYGFSFEEDEIIITAGGTHSMYLTMEAILDEGLSLIHI